MKTAIELKLTLTATIEKDEKTNLFSGWFEEFPQAIAIGEDEEDAKIKLMDAFKILLKARKEDVIREIIRNNIDNLPQININPAIA